MAHCAPEARYLCDKDKMAKYCSSKYCQEISAMQDCTIVHQALDL
jgi:hypothetical protein